MRVALLTTNLQPNNGWATVAVQRGAALMAMGIEVVALTARGDAPPLGITPTEVHAVLPRVHQGTLSTLEILAANPAIAQATAGCDLIDTVSEPYALGCLLAARSKPLVVTACGSYVPLASTRGTARAFYHAFFRKAHINAISAYTARRVAAVLGTPEPPVVLLGVDNDFYQAVRSHPAKRGPTVLSVGAVKKRKGIHILLEAIALARKSIPDIQCVVVGKVNDMGYTRKLRARIDALGLAEQFHLAGHLPYEELVGWYQTADVFALPSLSGKTYFEGFGLVLLEAGACGLPAIGTRDSGNESAIEDAVSGFLVEQEDVEALAGRIVEVLRDEALRQRLGSGAREFARAHTWERSARDILHFYEDVLAASRQEKR